MRVLLTAVLLLSYSVSYASGTTETSALFTVATTLMVVSIFVSSQIVSRSIFQRPAAIAIIAGSIIGTLVGIFTGIVAGTTIGSFAGVFTGSFAGVFVGSFVGDSIDSTPGIAAAMLTGGLSGSLSGIFAASLVTSSIFSASTTIEWLIFCYGLAICELIIAYILLKCRVSDITDKIQQ